MIKVGDLVRCVFPISENDGQISAIGVGDMGIVVKLDCVESVSDKLPEIILINGTLLIKGRPFSGKSHVIRLDLLDEKS
jgi:hypothetical protein